MRHAAVDDLVTTPRRWSRIVALGAGLCLAFVGAAGTSMAGTPTTEVLTLQQSDHTWTAAGAFTDTGSWATYRRALGGLPSPVAGAFTLFTTLTGSEGSIDLRLFVQLSPTGERDLCTVTAGTGAYSAFAGQGTWVQVGSGNQAVLTCTLQVNTG